MKFNHFRLARSPRLTLSSGRLWLGALAVAALASFAPYAPAQSDNFNTNTVTLSTDWVTSVCSNYPGTISFTTDLFGGKAMNLVAQTNTVINPTGGDQNDQNTPRIFAWVTNRIYTNFYVATDIIGWDTSIVRDTNGPLMGLMARATNVVRNANVPLGRPDGLVFIINVNRFGGTPQGTRGVVNIVRLIDGKADTLLTSFGLQGEFTVNPGHKYRMVFTGTNQFDELGTQTNGVAWGRIYDLEDLTRPLVTVTCPDNGFYMGFQINPAWSSPGYSGIACIGDGTNKSVNVTFDNFVASEYPPPSSVNYPGTPNGYAGVPQVINRTPSSWTNFYSAAGGISFTATTLTADTITNIGMFLNGVDVTSSLIITGPATNRSVTFSGLTSNVVYDARIELANNLGQKTTNSWTFDTFSEAYLALPGVPNIECEDFDFGGGQFIDNPVASGYTTTLTAYNNSSGTFYPWGGAINQGANGYVNQGSANNNGFDFFDTKDDNSSYESDYRPMLPPSQPGLNGGLGHVGTSEGVRNFDYNNPYVGQTAFYVYDTQRQKYSSVDPELQEYMLMHTDGQEWYNYTRTFFYSTNYYNVYLRNGCELTQKLRLSQIGAGPTTNSLGTFSLTNSMAKSNFRYTPLMDGSGKLAVVNFSGTTKLRLFVDELQEERVTRGVMLNYLAFVPALLVEASSQASTGYTIDTNATVELGSRKITIPQSGSARFYRVRWYHAVTITSVKLVGGNVELTYQ